MPAPDLIPDCQQCEALCCVLLAFDASDAFAMDKPACVPCHNLTADSTCRIHPTLSDDGFRGCAAYTCHGAGQRITSQVFAGRSWRRDPALLPAMADAFRRLRNLHEALFLLQQAANLPLPAALDQQRQDILTALNGDQDWSEAGLLALERSAAMKSVRPFLAALRHLPEVTAPRR